MAKAPATTKTDWTPTPKIAAAAGGGVFASLLIMALKRFLKIDMPPDIAAGIVAAITWATGYFKKDRRA